MEIVGKGLSDFLQPRKASFPVFRQRFPWHGADLQTVRNSLRPRPQAPDVHSRLKVPISGGQALSVAVTNPAGKSSRAIVLIHGLGGAEDSAYMEATTHFYTANGWRVYRMNYRGVGPSAETSTAPYSAGLTGDLRAVLNHVADLEERPFFAMGFSLGGQLLMRTLGEGDVIPALAAGFSVSAPLDLSASQRRLERGRNAPYIRYLVGNMKRDMRGVDHPSITADIDAIKSVLEFDEEVIARFFGFDDAQDYYRCVSCLHLLNKIQVPLAALHSADDPWIPVADYKRAKWPEAVPAGALILPRGGHVGFHGQGSSVPWFCTASHSFFQLFS